MTSVWEAGVRGSFRRWAAPVKSQAEQRTEKWHVFTVLWLRYSSKQYLEKVSLLCRRRLRQDRRRVGQEVTQQLVLALIMSRLDYCNSVLAGLYQRPRCSHYSASRMQLPETGVRLESLRARHADPDPAALAAGQLRNKIQAVLPRPRYPVRSQPGVSDGNSLVSRRQQITFRATLIITSSMDYSTAAAHEVRLAGVLTCGSCHLERSARQHPHRG